MRCSGALSDNVMCRKIQSFSCFIIVFCSMMTALIQEENDAALFAAGLD